MKKNLFTAFIGLWVILSPIFLFASNYTQTLAPTAETCTGNGALNIKISGANPNVSQFTFRVYIGTSGTTLATLGQPNPTSVAADATGNVNFTYNGFVNGAYRLEVTEIDGTNTKVTTTTFTVANQKKTATVTATEDVCTGTYIIAKVGTQSYGPYVYTLRNSAGTIIEQSAATDALTYNFTTQLANGTYTINLTDSCGNTVITNYTIAKPTYTYRVTSPAYRENHLSACDTSEKRLRIQLLKNGSPVAAPAQRFPLTVTFHPNLLGADTSKDVTKTFNTAAEMGDFIVNLYFQHGANNTYNVTFQDTCGLTYTQTNFTQGLNSIYFDLTSSITNNAGTCNIRNIGMSRIEAVNYNSWGGLGYKVVISSTATDFDPNTYYPGKFTYDTTAKTYTGYFKDYTGFSFSNVPAGTYTITLSDDCAHTMTKTTSFTPATYRLTKDRMYGACTDGSSTVNLVADSSAVPGISADTKLTSVIITGAPQAFIDKYGALPFDASAWINPANGIFYANSLPAGSYTFQWKGECGSGTDTLTMDGTIIANYSTTKNYTCTGADLSSTITSNYNMNGGSGVLWLQQYNPATGQWHYPGDPTKVYTEGSGITGTTGLQLTPNLGNIGDGLQTTSTISPIQFKGSGTFRVVFQYFSFNNGVPMSATTQEVCHKVMEEFDISVSGIAINNFIVSNCPDGTNNLIIDASGVNLKYQIIEKDGVAVTIPSTPQTSNIFTGLATGQYKVRISDSCGREQVFTFYVSAQEKLPVIQGTPFCVGQSGKLYVKGYDYLTYTWYKDGVAIPGASGVGYNTLNITNYDATKAGTYSVNITYPGSCLNDTLYYTIKADGIAPNAGTGQTITMDVSEANKAPLNLFSYLTAPYDNSGTWKETTSSGMLSDYMWDSTRVNAGTYTFTYTVGATCSGPASVATVTIILEGVCYKPAVTSGTALATNHGITSLGRAGAKDKDNWPMVRKGAWTALESKTKGFVVNRIPTTAQVEAIPHPVEGMMVYDVQTDCLKINIDGTKTGWKCFNTQTCP